MRSTGGLTRLRAGRSRACRPYVAWEARLIAGLLLFAGSIASPSLVSPAHGQQPVPRIVNGVRTQAYPEVGAFLYVDGGRRDTSCSGTLVGCRTVVTAAHCFCDNDLSGAACESSGLLDDARRSQVFALQHAGIFSLESVRVHPEFVFAEGGDIAVVRLGEPVEGIRPALINDVQRPPAGSRSRIVGFGVTDAVEYDSGIKRSGFVTLDSCVGVAPVDNHVCWTFDLAIGPPGEDSNTCFGDSGGPLFADLAGSPRLAGVTSGGLSAFGCADDRSFDTDVFVYRDWIRSIVGDDLGRTCGVVTPIGDAGAEVWTAEDELSVFEDQTDLAVNVPPNTVELRVFLNGMDASPRILQPNTFALAVRRGSRPTLDDFDCADTTDGAFGYCSFANPAPGTWYASAFWVQGFGTIQLTASVFGLASTPGPTATPTASRTPTATLTASSTQPPTATRTATVAIPPTSTRPATPTSSPLPTPGSCWGDCNGDGSVQIDGVIMGITIGLGDGPLSLCSPADADGDRAVTVDELVSALNSALYGCRPLAPTLTQTAMRPATATPASTVIRTASLSPTSAATRTATPTSPVRDACEGPILDSLRITGRAGTRGPALFGDGIRERDLLLPPGSILEYLELEILSFDLRGLLTGSRVVTFDLALRLLGAAAVEAQLGFHFVEPVPGTASAISLPLVPPGSLNPAAVIEVLMGAPLPPGATAQDIAVQTQVTSAGTGSAYFVAELRALGQCGATPTPAAF